jgi:hypothetical protein
METGVNIMCKQVVSKQVVRNTKAIQPAKSTQPETENSTMRQQALKQQTLNKQVVDKQPMSESLKQKLIEKTTKTAPKVQQPAVTRLNLNMDDDVYRHMKGQVAIQGITISQYVRNLVMRDLLSRARAAA